MGDLTIEAKAVGERRNMRTFWPIVIGLSAIIAFAGTLVSWSLLAPLESAALAPGFVSVETNRKTIKHLEGGIIGSIHVREGDTVSRGQKLIVLDPTQAEANLRLLRGRRLTLRAREARLVAEKLGHGAIVFPSAVLPADRDAKPVNPKLAKIHDGEVQIFEKRRQSLQSRISILKQQNAQVSERIKGLKKDTWAKTKQLKVIGEEISIYKGLLRKGLTQKPRLLELQRRQAEIQGSRSQNLASIAQSKQKLDETLLRVHDLRGESQREVAEQLREVQSELLDLESRITSAQDVLRRTVVIAPLDGTVVSLKIHTPNGVVRPGDPLLDIVPIGDRLLVDAQVNPRDIDVVHPGLLAKVHFTPFLKRHARPLQGRVVSISADRLIEDRSGEAYYLARIELTEKPKDILEGASLYPGMPAEVTIITGTRTTFDYMIEPITRSFNRAFRED